VPVKFLRIGPARDGVPQQVVLIPRALVGDVAVVRGSKKLHHLGLEVAAEDYQTER
jgi:hypothetical protein